MKVQVPLFVFLVKFAFAVRVGNWVSFTVTVKASELETLPFVSVAVHVTVVTPTLNAWFTSVVTVPVVAPVRT